MTVADLGHRMDADELGWWVAFYAVEHETDQHRDLSSMVEHELTRARQE